MAKDPAVLFYTSDFLSGAADLTMEERGQYITMLCLQHQKGELTTKSIRLTVGSVSDDVMAHFKKLKNGNYINERMQNEADRRVQYIESRRKSGLLGGRPAKANEKHKLNHTPKRTEDEDVNGNIDRNRDEFEKVRKAYSGTRRGLDTEFKNFQRHEDWKTELPKLYVKLHDEEIIRDHQSESNLFVPPWPHFRTWINQRRWEQEFEKIETYDEQVERLSKI